MAHRASLHPSPVGSGWNKRERSAWFLEPPGRRFGARYGDYERTQIVHFRRWTAHQEGKQILGGGGALRNQGKTLEKRIIFARRGYTPNLEVFRRSNRNRFLGGEVFRRERVEIAIGD